MINKLTGHSLPVLSILLNGGVFAIEKFAEHASSINSSLAAIGVVLGAVGTYVKVHYDAKGKLKIDEAKAKIEEAKADQQRAETERYRLETKQGHNSGGE